MSDTPTETPAETPISPPDPEQPVAPTDPPVTAPTAPEAPPPDQEETEQSPGAPSGEPDQAGETPPEEPEQAPEQPPSSPAQMEAMDKAYRSIERSATNYVTRVAEWGEEFEQPIVPCPICATFLPGFRYSASIVPFTEDEKKFARTVAGVPDEPPYKQADDAHMCHACDGYGQVLTGSQRNDQRTRVCNVCRGLGWEGAGAQETLGGRVGATVSQPQAPEQAPEDIPDTDPWGRAPGHPGFGKLPNLVTSEAELPPGWHVVNGVPAMAA